MTLLFLLACAPDPKPGVPGPEDTGHAPDTGTPVDTTDSSADSADSGGDTDETDDTAPPDTDTAPGYAVPTADAPFVVESCGFQDGTPSLFPVPDQDGDGEEELVVVVDADVEVRGAWLVPSSAATGPYWDQPLHWDAVGAIATLSDLDGDGLGEVYAVDGETVTRLLPDGTVETWTGVPTTFAAWHDVDGDGVAELLVGAPALSADGTTTGYVAVVTAADPDPTTWVSLATVPGEGLGVAIGLGTLDQDGDGHPEVVVTDAVNGYLLGSAALDAGGDLSAATLATFADVAERVPVALGDLDGGGVEDVVFPEPAVYGGYTRIFSGEAPDAPVDWGGPGSFGDVGAMAVGPDGTGGEALWILYGDVRAYDLADLLAGENTLLTSGWTDRFASDLAASRQSLWIDEYTLGSGWDTRVIAARLDPASADDVLGEVEGGGPGYGGDAAGASFDDLDGDGAPDWWQYVDDTLTHHAVVPGATVTVCDGTAWPIDGWSALDPGDDLDGDGVPEATWWAEPESTGLWSSAAGTVAEYTFDGALMQLGCDVTGDGVDEIQFVTIGRSWIVDGVAWLRDGIDRSVVAVLDDDGVCLGDLDGDGVSEVGTLFYELHVWDGASVGAGAPEMVASVDGPGLGGLYALGDVDGDGLGDLSFRVFGDRVGTCVLGGADLLATPTRAVDDVPCGASATYVPADVDGDGVNELLVSDATAGTITAWWPATDATEVVWTDADDEREEPLYTLVADAFGPGRPAVVLGPDPVVVYALSE